MTALDNIPSGWIVTWCRRCGYSIAFEEAAAHSYGVDWEFVFGEACRHACEVGSCDMGSPS